MTYNHSNIECIFCMEVPTQCHETMCCHSILCQICVNTIKKCPYCAIKLNTIINIPLNRIIQHQKKSEIKNDIHNEVISFGSFLDKFRVPNLKHEKLTYTFSSYFSDILRDIRLTNTITSYCDLRIINPFICNNVPWIEKIISTKKSFPKILDTNICFETKVLSDTINNKQDLIKFKRNNPNSKGKILWLTELGSCEIEINFRSDYTRTIICSSEQMIILLTFQNKNRIHFCDIKNDVKLNSRTLLLNLNILCDKKCPLLIKNECHFIFNEDFTFGHEMHQHVKILVKKIDKHMIVDTTTVDENIRCMIDDQIILTACTHKKIKMDLLIENISSIFKDNNQFEIKNRIDHLVGQNYLGFEFLNSEIYVFYMK